MRHKFISGVIIVAVAGGAYFWYASAHTATGKTTYVTTPVTKGSIVLSVSGSGQVSSSDQLDLKSKVSENVTYVGVKSGQKVRAGALLMSFNTVDAQKSVRDAKIALANAQLSLDKLTQSGSVTLPQSKQQAEDNLAKDYNDSFNTISNVFLDLPGMMTGLDDILHGTEITKNTPNIGYYTTTNQGYNQTDENQLAQYKVSAEDSYQKALAAYNQNAADYKLISRASDTSTIESMLQETYQTSQDISDAVKQMTNLIQLYEDIFTRLQFTINPIATTHLAALSTDTSKINTDISNLVNTTASIKSDKDAIATADLNAQSQDLSVQQQNLSLQQAQNSLADAEANLANCYIYAPFNGTVAVVNFNKGDAVSSGAVAVTIITPQSITKIPFNEIDISKIKEGQKATLTFDAIDSLTLVGQVTAIDTLGTVTQGVVNYNVTVAFDAQNTLVKPGMSVTASIITDVKQDVLTVPNSAVKTAGTQKYVQVLVDGAPVQKNVEVGLSNDTDTEITSGLNEGDNVVTQTITSTAAKTATPTTSSAIRLPGITGGGGGGGGFRTGN